MNKVEIYSDGSLDPKTKKGGWGCLVKGDNIESFMKFDSVENTTIGRMELSSVVEAIDELTEKSTITLTSDSTYVVNMIEKKWIKKWKKDNWRNTGGEVKNLDLVKRLDEHLSNHKIKAVWVKSHSGHTENEICDKVAKSQAFIK